MPWSNDPAKRQRDAEVYQDPEFVRNKAVVLRRAAGRCEQCGARRRLQVDHRTPVWIRLDHSLGNLWGLCLPCHQAKSAAEGHDARRRKPKRPAPRPRTQW
jgi:hypothetical protein